MKRATRRRGASRKSATIQDSTWQGSPRRGAFGAHGPHSQPRVCGAAPVFEWLRLSADGGRVAPVGSSRHHALMSAFCGGVRGAPRAGAVPAAPARRRPLSALRDLVAARREHVPRGAEVGRALAVGLAGLLVAGVEVERVAVVGHLRARLPDGRAEELGLDAGARLRLAVGQERRPELRAGAGARALAVLVLAEVVERAALPVDEDRAELRLADGDGRPAACGRAGRDRDGRDDGDGGQQGEEKGSCPHGGPPVGWLRVYREDAGARPESISGRLGLGGAWVWERRAARCHGRGRAAERRRAPRSGTPLETMLRPAGELLQLDARAGLLELGLELLGLVALDALLHGLRGLVDERLGLLQAQAGRRADDLDDLDLLVARTGEDDVDRRAHLLLGAAAAVARGGRGGRGDRRRRDAELLLERLDALGQLEHRDALQLVDPLLGRSHVVPPVASVVSGLRRSVRLVVVGRRFGVLRAALGGLLGRGRLGRRLGVLVRRLLGGAALALAAGRGRLGGGLGRDLGGRGLLGGVGRRGRGGGRLARRQLAALLLAEHLVERDRHAGQQRVEAARQARDRRGDHADELAVEDLARGQPGDRDDLLGVERVAVEQPALERQQLGLARERGDRLGGEGRVAAHERQRGRALEQRLEPVDARLVGGAFGQRVLDDAERRVRVAQARADVGRLRDGDPAEVDREHGLGLVDLVDDLGDRRGFLLSVHRPPVRDFRRRARRAARPGSSVARRRLRGGCRGLLEDVAGPPGVDLDARPHRRGDRDRADVAALRRRGLGADDLVDDRGVVLEQRAVLEARLADRQVDDRGAVGAVLDLAGLGLLDRPADVHRDRSHLRVRHLALRAEDAPEAADHRHHVRGRDRDVEVGEAVLHALGEIVGAHDVGAGLLGLARLVALREDGDRDALAEAVGQRDRAAQLLVGVTDVQARADVDLDGLVELRALDLLEEVHRLGGRVLALAVDLAARLDELLPVMHRHVSPPPRPWSGRSPR